MRTEIKTIKVPATTYQQTFYYSEDGKEFFSRADCIRYEYQQKIQNHKLYKTAIKNVSTYPEFLMATLYFIEDIDDYNFFVISQELNDKFYFLTDFKKYGKGWYIFWIKENSDTYDQYYLYNLNNYMNEMNKEFKEWEEEIYNKISKENEK